MKTNALMLADYPLTFFRGLTPNLERFFDELPMMGSWKLGEPGWTPRLDIFERDGLFVLRADLPGMTKDDVKIEVNDGVLAIEGERKTDFKEEKGGVYRMERAYGTFFRAVPLPEAVKPELVKATFKDGVLEVTVPLPAVNVAPKARRVEIEAPETAKKPAA